MNRLYINFLCAAIAFMFSGCGNLYHDALEEERERENQDSSGLVAYYPFSGFPGDLSENSNDGLPGTYQLTADRFGNPDSAIEFDGDDYMEVPHHESLNFGETGFTISAWIYFNSTGAQQKIFNKGTWVAPGNSWSIVVFEATHMISYQTWFNTALGPQVDGDSITINTGTWYHLAVTKSSGTISIYWNSAQIVSTSIVASSVDNTESLVIGKHINNSLYFNGKIDDIRIYDRALSIFEIDELFHEGGWTDK